MLEHATLLLQPWARTSAGGASGGVRTIVDATGAALGFARQMSQAAPWWLRWLSRAAVEVCEGPDNSLVFALRRNWGWPGSWHVLDADERLVGTVRSQAMLDGYGHFLAVIESPDLHERGRVLAIQGRDLANYAMSSQGTRLTFAAATEGNPFARMMILAAVLLLDI